LPYLIAADVSSRARRRSALDGIREAEFLDTSLSWLGADSAGLKIFLSVWWILSCRIRLQDVRTYRIAALLAFGACLRPALDGLRVGQTKLFGASLAGFDTDSARLKIFLSVWCILSCRTRLQDVRTYRITALLAFGACLRPALDGLRVGQAKFFCARASWLDTVPARLTSC
jgi:hypothetical protein